VPTLHGISHEHYARHATKLFIDRSGVPHQLFSKAYGQNLNKKAILFIFMKGSTFCLCKKIGFWKICQTKTIYDNHLQKML